MRLVIAITLSALMLGACTDDSKRVYFDGNYYPSKAKHRDKDNRKLFTATVRRAAQGMNGARAAALHAGTDYCIKNFGTSDIDWTVGPGAEHAQIVTSNGNVVVRGECRIW